MSWEGDVMHEKHVYFNRKKIMTFVIVGVCVLAAAAAGIFLVNNSKKESIGKPIDNNGVSKELDIDDPFRVLMEAQKEKEEVGAEVDISDARDENRTGEVTYGIDVSIYQGTIDWKKVAEAGIDFAMIRVGYRTMADGIIKADSNAKYNMQEATKHGIKVGVYFFSTAISQSEAVEEANWVSDYIAKYQITYPVAYDCEGYGKTSSRQYDMTNTQRTDAALAFMNQIKQRGYSPMFYGAKSEMEHDLKWEMSRISSIYSVWVAQYPPVYTATTECSYEAPYAMWQYTNQGSVSGIQDSVDMNIAYFGYAHTEGAKDKEMPEDVEADVEALVNFRAVNETVTAKEKTNLRDKPSQGADSKVMHTLLNGETATRTGVSDSGWSRVEYNGKKYYAVSSYLTTDLSHKPSKEEADDGIKTEFREVNEHMTAKEATNLRAKPSVNDEIAPVVVQIKKGDVVVRTGMNDELGWSRVMYNGQILYCVSSLLEPVQ